MRNCPQDCFSPELFDEDEDYGFFLEAKNILKMNYIYVIIACVLIIGIIITIALLLCRKKRPEVLMPTEEITPEDEIGKTTPEEQ